MKRVISTFPTRWVLVPDEEPIFSSMATTVEIDDEAAGCFLKVSQCREDDENCIKVYADEVKALYEAMDFAAGICKIIDENSERKK